MLQEGNYFYLSTSITQENCTKKHRNRIFLLNGPPGSGKDVLAEHLAKKFNGVHMCFKQELYEVAARVSGYPLDLVIRLSTDRATKEIPNCLFLINGQFTSPRNYLIHVSENVVKPYLGKDYFGKSLGKKVLNIHHNTPIFISDSGFYEEALALQKMLQERICILQIYREGYTFEGDSRSYLDPRKLTTDFEVVRLDNMFSTLEQYLKVGAQTVEELL